MTLAPGFAATDGYHIKCFLEVQGYTISHIEQSVAPGVFEVTIVNYAGQKQTLSVPKDELEPETLKIGDVL